MNNRYLTEGGFVLFISKINGKTRPLLDYTLHSAVEKETPLLYLSLEMDGDALINRLIEEKSGIGEGKIRKGDLSVAEFDSFRKGTDLIYQSPLFIEDGIPVELSDVEDIILKAKAESGVEIVVVDYPGLLKVNGEADSTRRLKRVCRELSRLSKDHSIKIVGSILQPRSGKLEDEEVLTSLADEVIDLRPAHSQG